MYVWDFSYAVCDEAILDSKILQLGVSKNNGTPKSSILIGFYIINPFWGTPIFGNIQLVAKVQWSQIYDTSIRRVQVKANGGNRPRSQLEHILHFFCYYYSHDYFIIMIITINYMCVLLFYCRYNHCCIWLSLLSLSVLLHTYTWSKENWSKGIVEKGDEWSGRSLIQLVYKWIIMHWSTPCGTVRKLAPFSAAHSQDRPRKELWSSTSSSTTLELTLEISSDVLAQPCRSGWIACNL